MDCNQVIRRTKKKKQEQETKNKVGRVLKTAFKLKPAFPKKEKENKQFHARLCGHSFCSSEFGFYRPGKSSILHGMHVMFNKCIQEDTIISFGDNKSYVTCCLVFRNPKAFHVVAFISSILKHVCFFTVSI